MINKTIDPGDILYDEDKDQLLVYSGHVVQDDVGQEALFCHNRDWSDEARSSKGVIYTGWVALKYLHWIGKME